MTEDSKGCTPEGTAGGNRSTSTTLGREQVEPKGASSGRERALQIEREARRALRRTRAADRILTVIVGLSLAAVAEVAARLGWVSPLILPAPSEVMGALWDGIIVGGV